jgi:SAM-dependent MidA family methyltransferase
LSDAERTALAELLRSRIERAGPISFRTFFESALYHPSLGYYTRSAAGTGRSGDFSTSPDVSPAFGQRLAVQAADVHERLGGGSWSLVELGPGRGLLAGDLLDGLARHAPRALDALEAVLLVEPSPALREAQARRLEAREGAPPTSWLERAGELAPGSVHGLILANEVLDALPVHAVVRRARGLRELFVDVDPEGGGFRFVDKAPVRPAVGELVDRYGLCPEPGHRAEVCLAMPSLLAEVSRSLGSGAAVFVDYGHDAARLAGPDHAEGTLLAYHRHRIVEDVLARPGEQDITAHVNWSHFEDAAREAGLTVAGRTYQDRFLLALGIVEDMARDPEAGPETPEAASFRLSARSLVLPASGGGRRFEVACLVRGIPSDLRGLSDPLAGLA